MSKDAIWFLAIIVATSTGIGLWLARRRWLSRRRRELFRRPFPPEWRAILQQSLPLYRLLPERLHRQLHGLINIFIEEKRFEGCGGQVITDEIRVLIAAQACLLLLNRKTGIYPLLGSVVVYPHDYVAPREEAASGHAGEVRSGESWGHGTVVLSWNAVRHGIENLRDGQNVVFHEFAHQLDQESGAADGAPPLEQAAHYAAWAAELSVEYQVLREKAWRRKKSVLDHYGATNPAEFFAVLTETFFEKPHQLKRRHPGLYREMRAFYKVDPRRWHPARNG